MRIHKLKHHPYCATIRNGEVLLCSLEDDGSLRWFAGDYFWETLKRPIQPALIQDLCETLGVELDDVGKIRTNKP